MSTPHTTSSTSCSDIQNYFSCRVSGTREQLINYISIFLGPKHYDDEEAWTASLRVTLEHIRKREFPFPPDNPFSNEDMLKLDQRNERMCVCSNKKEDLAAMFESEMECFNRNMPDASQLERGEFHSRSEVRKYYRNRIEDLKEELSNMEKWNRRQKLNLYRIHSAIGASPLSAPS